MRVEDKLERLESRHNGDIFIRIAWYTVRYITMFSMEVARKELYIVASVDRYIGVNRRNWSIECGLSLFRSATLFGALTPISMLKLCVSVYDVCPCDEPGLLMLISLHSSANIKKLKRAKKEKIWI